MLDPSTSAPFERATPGGALRPTAELELPLRLDRTAGTPLQHQLVAQLRDAVLSGVLAAGQRLPASRALAGRLGVARSTVLVAFEQLLGEGVLEARHGSGTYVAAGVARAIGSVAVGAREEAAAPLEALIDLRPGRPDTTRLPDAGWRRAWREAAASVPDGEPPAAGVAGLREAIARHVATARAVPADPADVVVCGGTREALALLVRALGLHRVGVEDPGYADARRALAAAGAEPVPLAVDEAGLRVDLLPEGLDALVVTPSHQYPLGGTMPLARRLALVEWARRTRTVLIEDDYDGEFRYDVLPLPALAALDPAGVVHVGTFAKSISPWLRTGYLLVPDALRPRVLATRTALGQPVDGVTQTALAAFVGAGDLARHIARSRRDHRHRRARLLELLAPHAALRPIGSSAGLHVVIELPEGADARAMLAATAARGVLLADLDDYRLASSGPPSVVLGYGAARMRDLEAGVDALVAATRA